MQGAANEEVNVEQKQLYEAKVRDNYRANKTIGIWHGIIHYTAMGFYYQTTVLSTFIYDLTGSRFLVGLISSLGALANQLPQLFATTLVEHLPEKKKMLLWFGVGARLPWLLMSLTVLFLDKQATLIASMTLYTIATVFMGMYLLAWTDLMSKVIPLEYRGNYFGLRNFLASSATALAGVGAGKIIQAYLPSPIGYAISFCLAFAIHFVDLWILAKTKEEPSLRVGKKSSVIEKLAQIPTLFREDPNFARYCYIRALASFCMMGFPFYVVFARQQLNIVDLDPRTGTIIGVFTFTQVFGRAVGNLLWGAISQTKGYKIPLEQACLIVGIASIATVFMNSYYGFIAVLAIAGVASAGFYLSSLNILMEFGKSHQRPTYIGVSNAFAGIGGFIPPFIGGIIAQRISYQAVYWLTGVSCIITFLLMYYLVVDPRRIAAYQD